MVLLERNKTSHSSSTNSCQSTEDTFNWNIKGQKSKNRQSHLFILELFMNLLRRLGVCLVIVVLIGSVVSFFGNPTIKPIGKVLDPAQELNAPEFKGFIDKEFGDRVVNSTWAMVLVHSEFSNDNASGLEALRNWAKSKFTLDRQFLDPIILPESRSSSTVLGALANSVLGLPIKLIDSASSAFLSLRIESFHKSNAYQSFRVDFYDLFGVNQEAVKLLYAYQEERAKVSLLVLQSAFFWFITVVFIGVNHFKVRKISPDSALRKSLSIFWAALSLFYLVTACTANNVEVFAGAIFSTLIAIYLAFPIALNRKEGGAISWFKYELSTRAQLILLWLTFSLVGIQIISWIKGGILTNPDPVTLLIGSLTGNFVHDPIGIKRSITELLGVTWLGLTIFTAYTFKTRASRSREIETELKSLARQKVSIQ